MSDTHHLERFMRVALAMARRGLGVVAPNPAVGCVLVQEDRIVARGWTGRGGRPHAETQALDRAGAAARGASCYVTLEPCDHQGETPPCAQALIDAGIGRCVVAVRDPDPRVDGGGIARLRAAGIEVFEGVLADEARALNLGFFRRVETGRPLVTLKVATSLDGGIASHNGDSRWITGEAARARAHLMRAEHDAIMVGFGTAITDEPSLTCRLPGLEDRSPIRVVVDGRLQLPLTSRMVAEAAAVPTWLITRNDADDQRRAAYEGVGVEVIGVDWGEDGRPLLEEGLAALAKRGVTRLLVEGGGRLAASFLASNLVDRVAWFRAPILIGGDAIPAVAALGIDRINAAPRFTQIKIEALGEDMLETYAVIA